jgi:ABC-2 type transport system permease protein
MTIASTQALILLVLAPFIGVSIHIVSILELFLFFLVLSFAISGSGLLIASLMKTTESFGVVMQVLIFPMFFLSGAFFPLTSIPGWLSVISRINPLTYGVDAARQILLGPQTPAAVLEKLSLYPIHIDILALAIFSLIVVSAAVWAFNRRD